MIIVDLGFGDAGKGTITDFLTRETGAGIVARFNGGAQAGHNVVTPDGRHHTFSQIGAGSFVPGVRTYLGPAFVLHPGGLLYEARHLAEVGVADALDRLTVHPDALVISPFQQAAGRLRELARGAAAHGTCGVGVGEAVSDALSGHGDVIRARHLADASLRDRLRSQQARKRGIPATGDPRCGPERALLLDPEAVDRVLALWSRLRLRIGQPALGAAVFEGAQGVLLDETWGFHPHTTWSDCTPAGALALAPALPPRLGVVRAYATRHGPGPFPTHDPGVDLPEAHNRSDGWQGAFRTGPLDLVLLRYALAVSPVDALAITCLDRVPEVVPICTRYAELDRLDPGPADDLGHRERLGALLRGVTPVITHVARNRLVEHLEAALDVPVHLESWGPTAAEKRWRYS